MTKTREKGEQFTFSTSDTPNVAGFDGADGGRDALVVPHSRQV